jgi:hypothetical protein
MAATVKTYVYTGAGPTGADSGDVLRYKLADNNTIDTSNPLILPSSGTNYSWIKTVALYATVAPSTSISNVKLYSDGTNSLGTGRDIKVKENVTYTQASDATQIDTPDGSMFDYTSGSPLSITGSLGASTGKVNTNYVQLQAEVADTGSSGLCAAAETFTWQYDEA